MPTGEGMPTGVHRADWSENRRKSIGIVSPPYTVGRTAASPRWIHSRMEHGQTSLPHAHSGWTCTVVIEGSWYVGGELFTAGQMVIVEPDIEYGPFEPGEDAVTILEVFENEAAMEAIWREHAAGPRVS